jgi:large repetitive protein
MSKAYLLLNGRVSTLHGRGASGLETKTVKNLPQRRHNKLAIPALLAFTALVLALALTTSAQAGIWNTTGSLHTARGGPAIFLDNGQVLVVGGSGNSMEYEWGVPLNSAELYNPATRLWSNTGFMHDARSEFTITRLLNGKVLAVGGTGISGELNSCELYDPATETWNPTGPIATARMMHAATRLPDGRVLVAGGTYYNSVTQNYVTLDSAELYDPATELWSPTGSLKTARKASLVLLPNGKVLAAGGGGSSGFLDSAELYNPGTGLWSYTGSLNTARYAEVTLLFNGKVLVAGGWSGEWTGSEFISYPLSSVELYDPATQLWSYTGSLKTARQEQPATLLGNGQVLTFGGYGRYETILSSGELYNPATGLWRATGSLNNARVGQGAILLPNGKVLAAGGRGSHGTSGILASAELYTPGEALPGINLLLLD